MGDFDHGWITLVWMDDDFDLGGSLQSGWITLIWMDDRFDLDVNHRRRRPITAPRRWTGGPSSGFSAFCQKAETGPVFNKIWFMIVGGLEYLS
jgi:hypothetical protein